MDALYTAVATANGREGRTVSSDGHGPRKLFSRVGYTLTGEGVAWSPDAGSRLVSSGTTTREGSRSSTRVDACSSRPSSADVRRRQTRTIRRGRRTGGRSRS